jgi:hypothetical protein
MVLSLPKRHPDLAIEKTAHHVIIHDRRRDYVHTLNARAATVLDRCDGTRTCDEIAKNLSHEMQAPYDRVAGEVAHLVAAFADLALIESASEPAERPA